MKNILTLLMLAFTMTAFAQNSNGYAIGDKAEDFTLKGVDGEMYTLSDYKDVNGYVVIFTCNSCPYAIMYEDRMKEIAGKAKEMGFAMVAVNPNDPEIKPEDSFDNMIVRSNEKRFNFPYLFDADQTVFPQYGATKTPHVFIMDKNMTVQYIGAIDDNARDAAAVQINYVESAMKSIKRGKAVNPATTKAIGCGIKAKA